MQEVSLHFALGRPFDTFGLVRDQRGRRVAKNKSTDRPFLPAFSFSAVFVYLSLTLPWKMQTSLRTQQKILREFVWPNSFGSSCKSVKG